MSRDLNKRIFRVAQCNILKPTDKLVQNGLSLTPRDVKHLSDRGMAVSTQNVGQVVDPEASSGYLPLEQMRGVDLNTCWEASQRARQNILRSYKLHKHSNEL